LEQHFSKAALFIPGPVQHLDIALIRAEEPCPWRFIKRGLKFSESAICIKQHIDAVKSWS